MEQLSRLEEVKAFSIGSENISNRAVRDGEMALPVYGDTVKMKCALLDCKEEVEIPTYIFDKNNRVKREYCSVRLSKGVCVGGREFVNGNFISPNSYINPFFYSRLECWLDNCVNC